MKHASQWPLRQLAALVWIGLLLAMPTALHAGPGAHGPNGEHLDGVPAAPTEGETEPHMETHTEDFELVAKLDGGELLVLIDRFATNEPLLDADVQVESQGITAKGTFHQDHGDYAFTDKKLLAALARPGQHALVFTVVKGDDNDLLEGVLVVAGDGLAEADDDHGHAHGSQHDDHEHHSRQWLTVAALLLLAVGGGWWFMARKRHGSGKEI